MDIKYRIVGLKKLQDAVALAPGMFAERNREALEASVALVKRETITRLNTGPGHFGYHARDRFSTSVKIGQGRSLQTIGRVSTDAPQVRWGERGTKAHEIAPRRAMALSLGGAAGRGVDEGLVALVHNPGEKARHTMRNALRDSKTAIRGFFVGATIAAMRTMATSGGD